MAPQREDRNLPEGPEPPPEDSEPEGTEQEVSAGPAGQAVVAELWYGW